MEITKSELIKTPAKLYRQIVKVSPKLIEREKREHYA